MSLRSCPDCGCPDPLAGQRKKKKRHTGLIILAVVIALLVIAALVFNGLMRKAGEAEYYTNMESAAYKMLDGAAEAENAGNLIVNVWNNAIFEESDAETDKYTMQNGRFVEDFNDALSNLYADETFAESISKIESNQSEVTELMKKLKDPPKKYKEAYEILETYYNNYTKLTNAAISPTGTLQTFSDDFNTYDEDTVNSYDKMKLYLE